MEVTVENVAACKKKLSITIPREEVETKMNERFAELEREALVPGFRPGRAPRRLIEKRFRDAVAEEVRAKLVAETFEKAIKDQNLDVLGEPDVSPDAIKMTDDGPLTFSVELEVRPEFDLPDYVGIPLRVERPAVTDQDVEQALANLRDQYGRLEPAPEGSQVQTDDIITADLGIQTGDVLIVDRPGVRLPVAAIAVEGIRLENLPEVLKDAKVGETRSAKITISDTADREDVRGKEAEVRIKVNAIERVVRADDATILKQTDYETLDSLKAGLRRELESRREAAYQQAQQQAVENWLLEKVQFELPADLAQRHANRLLQRQLVNLQYRGVPVEEIEKSLEDIRSATTERAARELKLTFILDAIGKKEKIEVTDAEVDARVRFIAAQYGRRDDRLREEMEARGTLDALRAQIREDKVLRMLVEKAKVETPQAETGRADQQTTPTTPPAGSVETT